MNQKNDPPGTVAIISAFVMIPFLLAIPPMVGWWVGTWLDEKLGFHSLFEFGLITLGFMVGCRDVYKIIKRFGYF